MGQLGLGHRRLAVIDLSLAGKQPMSNEDGTIWITFNGEIYNFREIRLDLEKRGHTFQSNTDVEVVVHGYEEWGVHCLQKLNGMFAFALWDDSHDRLWLVRDRIGVKPLFYCALPHKFLFGSEIKAILCDPDVNRTLDYEVLTYYLSLNYTPAPYTLFAGIRQIPPGCWLIVDESGKIHEKEYWDLQFREDENHAEETYRNGFVTIFEDSVRQRLVSDVPFGALLSGGLDSSSIVYYMSQLLKDPVKTFSIGFKEKSFDEEKYSQLVAGALNTNHHQEKIFGENIDLLPKIVWHSEEPTADSSMLAVYHIAKFARQYVTMVLTGDGADEILAGYETYQAYYLHQLFNKLPASLQSMIMSSVLALPVSDKKLSLESKLKRFVAAASAPWEDAHGMWRMIFSPDLRAELLQPIREHPGTQADFLALYRASFARTNARHPLNRLLYVDTRLYLPNDMLVKIDRMTMAHGLEARQPFLDYRLVEYMASVPPSLKMRNFFTKKYLLKVSMNGKLPKEIVNRKKQGFNVPNSQWMKQDSRDYVLDLLSSDSIRRLGFLDEVVVTRILQDHMKGKVDYSHQIWCLLVLVLWHQQFIYKNKG